MAELILLPVVVPLLLAGYLLESYARKREDDPDRILPARAWRQTWFSLNGTPPSARRRLLKRLPLRNRIS